MSEQNSAQWALDLFKPDPLYEENFLSKHWHFIVLPATTVGGILYSNLGLSRPWYAGAHRYGIALAVGLFLAKVLKDMKTHREAERDAILRYYIRTHPEDFPEPERKKWSEVFDKWYPMR